jgi:hypothetical protein
MVWTYFRSLRSTVARVPTLLDETEQKDQVVLAILLSVTSVEAFVNLYFRTLVEDVKYAQHRLMVLDDLDGIRPKGLEYKLKHWPQRNLGKNFAWKKGVARDFDRLRKRRNALMHFTNSFETIEIPGIRIQGLADTACPTQMLKNSVLDWQK